MSIMVLDILELPSMHGAEVSAGHDGLTKAVSSVTVLEYAEMTPLLKKFYRKVDSPSNEISITSFSAIRNDVDLQCEHIRYNHAAGDAGTILYYVGLILPEIDQRVIDLCNDLAFPLICMPRNATDLRYSNAIGEITELIYNDRLSNTSTAEIILQKFAEIPPPRRSIDSLLRMLSDRLQLSIFITDISLHVINEATWPRVLDFEIDKLLLEKAIEKGDPDEICHDAKKWGVKFCSIENVSNTKLCLFLAKESAAIENDTLEQVRTAVQTAIHLWSKDHGNLGMAELISAILKDEPTRMHHLAAVLNIDISSFHHLLYIEPASTGMRALTGNEYRIIQSTARRVLRPYCTEMIDSRLSDEIVIFSSITKNRGEQLAAIESLSQEITEAVNHEIYIAEFSQLRDTSEARHAYLDIQQYLNAAKTIYPLRKVFTGQEISFAKSCCELIRAENVQEYAAVFALQNKDEKSEDLIGTITTLLLDADSSMNKAASILNLHKNTIKYRIGKYNDLKGCNIFSLPDVINIYTAAALHRLSKSDAFRSEMVF